MKSIREFAGKTIVAKSNYLDLEKDDFLLYGKDILARLHWKPKYLLLTKGSLTERFRKANEMKAEGNVKEGKWTFSKSGFLKKKITISRGLKTIATANYGRTGSTEMIFENGKKFKMKPERFWTKSLSQ